MHVLPGWDPKRLSGIPFRASAAWHLLFGSRWGTTRRSLEPRFLDDIRERPKGNGDVKELK